jgi:hypothetical protein
MDEVGLYFFDNSAKIECQAGNITPPEFTLPARP